MSNVDASPHSLAKPWSACAKWASITGFGVLLVVLGFAALFFSLIATVATVTLNGVLFLISVYVLGTLLGVDLLFHGVGRVSFGMGLHSRS